MQTTVGLDTEWTSTEMENEINKDGQEVDALVESVCASTGKGCEYISSKYTFLSHFHLCLKNDLLAF